MEGRFIVKLPFKTEHSRCQNGKLFEMAARRFMSLEKKLQSNQDFQREYTKKNSVKQVQGIEFKNEIKQLRSRGCVPKESKIRNLCPIFDEIGILRVGGRIQQSKVDYDTQHPIILPAKSHLSRLLIMNAHKKTWHSGPQIMLNYLRSKYWILRAKDQVKKYYRECTTCIRYSKKTTQQLMGQLPEVRLKPSPPFSSGNIKDCLE
ncbi:unnamed protein product [Euphydryas editha]|uniref:Integrase zinc-binding domain-containing protein n=1 Tax=Euphydryas editha TaxID=104508 RepID=A0AAU9V5V5_EUPED|nr:unnamed protein product [Euphydryas editha]